MKLLSYVMLVSCMSWLFVSLLCIIVVGSSLVFWLVMIVCSSRFELLNVGLCGGLKLLICCVLN